MSGAHDRGKRRAASIRNATAPGLASSNSAEGVFLGKASEAGVLFSKEVRSSADAAGVLTTTEIHGRYACDCGRLADQENGLLGTCATCGTVTCASCTRACTRCGRNICVRHATSYAPAEGDVVFLCRRHRLLKLAWSWIGGGP